MAYYDASVFRTECGDGDTESSIATLAQAKKTLIKLIDNKPFFAAYITKFGASNEYGYPTSDKDAYCFAVKHYEAKDILPKKLLKLQIR